MNQLSQNKKKTNTKVKKKEFFENVNGIIILRLPYYQHVLNEHGFVQVGKFHVQTKDWPNCQQLIYAHADGFVVGIGTYGDIVNEVNGSCCRKATHESRMAASHIMPGSIITAFDGRDNLEEKLEMLKGAESMPKPDKFNDLRSFKFSVDTYGKPSQETEGQLADSRSMAQIRFDQMPDWVKGLFDQNNNLLPQNQPVPKL